MERSGEQAERRYLTMEAEKAPAQDWAAKLAGA